MVDADVGAELSVDKGGGAELKTGPGFAASFGTASAEDLCEPSENIDFATGVAEASFSGAGWLAANKSVGFAGEAAGVVDASLLGVKENGLFTGDATGVTDPVVWDGANENDGFTREESDIGAAAGAPKENLGFEAGSFGGGADPCSSRSSGRAKCANKLLDCNPVLDG